MDEKIAWLTAQYERANKLTSYRGRWKIAEEIAQRPDVSLDDLYRAARKRVHALTATIVLRAMGYPRNASAVASLIGSLEDANGVEWAEAARTLAEMPHELVIPRLVRRLMQLLEDLRANPDSKSGPGYWMDGITAALGSDNMPPTIAISCAPLLAAALALPLAPDELDRAHVLSVFERIGPSCAIYALPSLLALIHSDIERDVKERAERLIASSGDEARRSHPTNWCSARRTKSNPT